MKKSFDELMSRHEMGIAYKHITEQMGPSPQLVAFVNYDKVTEESVGLESFDIISQHEAILAEIKNDNSFEMACESFGKKVISFLEKLKNLVTRNRNDENLKRFLENTVTERKSSILVESYSDFSNALNILEQILPLAYKCVSLFPKTKDVIAWKEFQTKHLKDKKSDVYQLLGKIKTISLSNKSRDSDTVDFVRSQWTVENFKKGIADSIRVEHDLEKLEKAIKEVLGCTEELVHKHAILEIEDKNSEAYRKNHSDEIRAVDAMHRAYSVLDDDIVYIVRHHKYIVDKSLKHVSNHFKIVE